MHCLLSTHLPSDSADNAVLDALWSSLAQDALSGESYQVALAGASVSFSAGWHAADGNGVQ